MTYEQAHSRVTVLLAQFTMAVNSKRPLSERKALVEALSEALSMLSRLSLPEVEE